MIYTVTFNPAIDYVIHTDKITMGKVNKYSGEKTYFGGKGINVSYVLAELGIKSTALGFVAGFTGKNIEDIVTNHGCRTDFVYLKEGLSRINVKVMGKPETEINGNGPCISDDDVKVQNANLIVERVA